MLLTRWLRINHSGRRTGKTLCLLLGSLVLCASLPRLAVAQSVIVHNSFTFEDGDPKFDADGVKNGVVVWKGGAVHVALGVFVGKNETLIIQPGAIVKFAGTFELDANGHLKSWSPPLGATITGNTGAIGATGGVIQIDGATLTDIRDDSVGGDTNQDGGASSVPANSTSSYYVAFSGTERDFLRNSTIKYCDKIGHLGSMNITNNKFLIFGRLISSSSFPGNTGCVVLNAVPVISGNTFEMLPNYGVIDLQGMSAVFEDNTIRGGSGVYIGPSLQCVDFSAVGNPVGPTFGVTKISNNRFEGGNYGLTNPNPNTNTGTLYTLIQFRAEINNNKFISSLNTGNALTLTLDSQATVTNNEVSGWLIPLTFSASDKTTSSRLDISGNRFSLVGDNIHTGGANNLQRLWQSGNFIKAKNNYWGDQSGPNDSSNADGLYNPRGKGLKLSDGIDYLPFVGGTPPPPKDSLHITVSTAPAPPFNPNATVTFNAVVDAYELVSAASGKIFLLIRDADGTLLNQSDTVVSVTSENRTATLPPVSLKIPELTDVIMVEAAIVPDNGGESVRSNTIRFAVIKPVSSFSITSITDAASGNSLELVRGNNVKIRIALSYNLSGANNGHFEFALQEQVRGTMRMVRMFTGTTLDAPPGNNKTATKDIDLLVPLHDVLKEQPGEVFLQITFKDGAGTTVGKLGRILPINEDANRVRYASPNGAGPSLVVVKIVDGEAVVGSSRYYFIVGEFPGYACSIKYTIGTQNVTNWQLRVGDDEALDEKGAIIYQYAVAQNKLDNASTGPERGVIVVIKSTTLIPPGTRKLRSVAKLIAPGNIVVAVAKFEVEVREPVELSAKAIPAGASQVAFNPLPVTLNFSANQKAGTATVTAFAGNIGVAAAVSSEESTETVQAKILAAALALHRELILLKKFWAVNTDLQDGTFTAKLRLGYNPTSDFPPLPGLREDDLVIVALNPLSGEFEALPSMLDKAGHAVTADYTTFFDTYALAFNVNVETATSVSAASFRRHDQAAQSIVAAFGVNLASATQSGTTLPLPTELAGTRVVVRDSTGMERLAPLFFVSPGQVNYQIPPGTANGTALVLIGNNNGALSTERLEVVSVNPALFAANANGQGVTAAVALRIKANGAQSYETMLRLDPGTNRFVSVPLDLGPVGDQVYLILFGTGLRQRSSQAALTVSLGGANSEVIFSGAQGSLVGLDQVNVRLPRALIGRGEVDLVLMADGKVANTVRVNIK